MHENSKLKPGENMLCTDIVSDIQNNLCSQHVLSFQSSCTCNSMNNLLSHFGLVDAKISASEKDLPVPCRHKLSLYIWLTKICLVFMYADTILIVLTLTKRIDHV